MQGWAEDASNVDNCCYCSDKLIALLFYFFKSSRTDLRSIGKACCFPSNNVLVMFQAHCYSLFAVSAAHRAKTAHRAPSLGAIHWCHLQGCAEKLDEKQVYIVIGKLPPTHESSPAYGVTQADCQPRCNLIKIPCYLTAQNRMIIFWHQWVQINLPRAWKTLRAFHIPYLHQAAEVKEDCSPIACERCDCIWPSSCFSNVYRSVEHMKCTQLQIVVCQYLHFTRASLMCPQLQYVFFQYL